MLRHMALSIGRAARGTPSGTTRRARRRARERRPAWVVRRRLTPGARRRVGGVSGAAAPTEREPAVAARGGVAVAPLLQAHPIGDVAGLVGEGVRHGGTFGLAAPARARVGLRVDDGEERGRHGRTVPATPAAAQGAGRRPVVREVPVRGWGRPHLRGCHAGRVSEDAPAGYQEVTLPTRVALPRELDARRLGRRAALVIGLLGVLGLVAWLAPGLGEVRDRLGD